MYILPTQAIWHSMFISDYNYVVEHNCLGRSLPGSYTTFEAAERACANNVECGCIDQYNCNDGTWSISRGYEIAKNDIGSCSWHQGKLTLPFHTRNLIYFRY